MYPIVQVGMYVYTYIYLSKVNDDVGSLSLFFHYSNIYVYGLKMNLFCPSIGRALRRIMVCIGMLYVDDMCAFHALYIRREREREGKRTELTKREVHHGGDKRSKEKIPLT